MKTPNRILVIQTSFIGDVILATAALEALHEKFPATKIDLLIRKGNESLFFNHPFVGELIIRDKSQNGLLWLLKTIPIVRNRNYDVVINLHRHLSSGIISALSGAKHRIGFDKNPMHFLFSKTIKHQFNGIHEVDRNRALLNLILGSTEVRLPKLYPQQEDFEYVALYKNHPYRCVAPASVWFTKQWPEQKWVELIEAFPDDAITYLLGAGSDHGLCERIASSINRNSTVNLAGKLSFLQSAALMQDATMNYVNDSAPMHIASAVNAPVTVIYCSTVPEFGFGPLSTVSKVVQTSEKLSCRPCGIHGRASCPKEHFKCAKGITIDEVIGHG